CTVAMLESTLVILFVAVFTAFLGEGLTWLLVYRTEKYKKLRDEVDKQSRRLEKRKDTSAADLSDKSAKRKLEKQEERLKSFNRDLSFVNMKSMLAIFLVFTALFSMFNSIFDGRVVAKLPFVPVSLLQGISHRNLLGEDYSDCSFTFLYVICTMSVRQNVQKLLGFAPSRSASKQSGFFGQSQSSFFKQQ
ncbi:hypothetical protein BOX15_Mlig007528g1, partial [Macrostomum lignano]